MACSLCHSTETNDRRNTIPLVGVLADRVRQALALGSEAQCFTGLLPKVCSQCVSNVETIETALKLRQKMRLLLDSPPVAATSGRRSRAGGLSGVALRVRDGAVPPPDNASPATDLRGFAAAAAAAAAAVVTEADSSGQDAADDRPSLTAVDAAGTRSALPAKAQHPPVIAAAVAFKTEPSGSLTLNGDANVQGGVQSLDLKTSASASVAPGRQDSSLMADFDEACRRQQQSSTPLGSAVSSDTKQHADTPRSPLESHGSGGGGATTNGSSVPHQSPSERQLRSGAAAALSVVAAASAAAGLREVGRSPELQQGLATKKVARSAAAAAETAEATYGSAAALAATGSSPPPPPLLRQLAAGGGRQLSSASSHVTGGGGIAALVVCKHCGKGFNSYSVLRVHLRSHTGEKPFTCRHCGVGFTQSQHARSHERRVHERTDGKQFRCSTCNAAYWRLGMLKAHERIHSPQSAADGSGGSTAATVGGAALADGDEYAVAGQRPPLRGNRAATRRVGPLRGSGGSRKRTLQSAMGGRSPARRTAASHAWYGSGQAMEGDDGLADGGGTDDCVETGRPATEPASALLGRLGADGGARSKRYRCDQCDDAFWKIGHLMRHKTFVHSAVEDDGGGGLLSTFAHSPGGSLAEAMSASSSASSLHGGEGLSSDSAEAAESSGEDGFEGSQPDAAGTAGADGSAYNDAAAAALPIWDEPWPRGRLSRRDGRRKPRKSPRVALGVRNDYAEDDRAAYAAADEATTDGRADPSAHLREEPELSFQSSSVFPRGDNDWVELSGISLASATQSVSAAGASLDGVVGVAGAAEPAAEPACGWRLSCSECNEHFAFKQGLQRHIKTVHVRKNKHACHACTASFILEKNLKQHVANAHSGGSRDSGAAPFGGAGHANGNDVSGGEAALEDDASGVTTDAEAAGAAAATAATARSRPTSGGGRATAATVADGEAAALGGGIGCGARTGDGADGFGYSCKDCGSTFRSKAVLRAHARVHEASDEFPYGCHVCGARFMAEKYLTQHAVVHGEKQFECDVCRLRFSRRASLLQHMSCSHFGRCDYACDGCTATFNNPTALTKHKHRMHTDDQCDAAAAAPAASAASVEEPAAAAPQQLRQQQRQPTADGQPRLQAAHSRQQRLLQQQPLPGSSRAASAAVEAGSAAAAVAPRSPASHASKPGAAALQQQGGILYPPARFFECQACRSSFGSLSALSLHKHRVHGLPTARSSARAAAAAAAATDGERNGGSGRQSTMASSSRGGAATQQPPSAHAATGGSHLHCNLCNRKFSSMSSRAAHMRLHTGERPYACTVCGRRFVQSVHLKSHMRLHTGEKPYVCAVCGMAHRHRSGYMKHMRNHHGSSSTETRGAAMGRRVGAGRSKKDTVRPTAGAAAASAKIARSASSSLLHDDVSESQSDLSLDNLDDQDSYDDGVADEDATRLNESTASAVRPRGDVTGGAADITCNVCYEILPSSEAMNAHVISAHSARAPTGGDAAGQQQKSFSCSDCGERFLLRFLLKQHMKKRHDRSLAD